MMLNESVKYFLTFVFFNELRSLMAQNPYGNFRLTVGTNKSFYAMCNYLIFTEVSIALILSSNKRGGFQKPPSKIQNQQYYLNNVLKMSLNKTICFGLIENLWPNNSKLNSPPRINHSSNSFCKDLISASF